MKHKGIDYKTSAVQYYLNNNESMDKVCKIFNCKKSTLKAWVHKYNSTKLFEKKVELIMQLNLDFIVFDENHFHGTTQMSKNILQSYSSQKTIKLTFLIIITS